MNEATILYEDNHIIVLNKPAGLLSQGDSTERPSIYEELKQYIKLKYNKPSDVFLGLVHRLDRHVSGVMVFARTSKAAKRLHSEFLKQNIEKFYIAITEKKNIKAQPANSNKWTKHESFLKRVKDKTFIDKQDTDNAQYALMHRFIISETDNSRLNLICLGTGRKHQIRAQLSFLGEPVYGDKKYNAAHNTGEDKILLHSAYLSFLHPTKRERMEFYSQAPDYFFQHIELTPNKVKEKVLKGIDKFRESSLS